MIKKFSAIFLSVFLLLPLSVSAEMEIFKIGYVVVEKILKEAPQTAASNKKLEKEFKSRTDGLQKKVKAIQKQEKDFNKNSVTMTDAERQKAQKKINEANKEIENLVGTRTRMMQSKLKNVEQLEVPKTEEDTPKLIDLNKEEES